MHLATTLRFIVPLCILSVLSACATVETTRTIPVDDTFSGSEFNWSARGAALASGRQMVLAKVIDVDGMLELCGAWGFSGTAGREAAYSALQDLAATVNGQVIHSGLGFFKRGPNAEFLFGVPANCIATGTPTPTGAINLDLIQTYDGLYRLS